MTENQRISGRTIQFPFSKFRGLQRAPFSCLAAFLSFAVLAGCVVGPNFKKPGPPAVPGYTPSPFSMTTNVENVPSGEAQRILQGADIPGEWWSLFHSTQLNDLIERALKTNPSIQSAQAALLVARETTLAQRGLYYPTITGGLSATRNRTSSDIAPVPNSNELNYSLYTPQVIISYVPDMFGLNRRTVESLQAQQEQARYALAATHITLSSNVANAAIQEASLRGQIDATNELIKINTDELQILRTQFANGYVGRLDVAAQESQLAQVVATLPPLLKQLAQDRDLIAALAGGFPANEEAEKFELASLQLPQDLPVSLPSLLVEHRPDVREAEENLHFASAQIGVAVANRLPSFTLTADAGTMAVEFAHIVMTGFWDVGAAGLGTIFDGRALSHRELAAKAAYTEAEAQYRSVVLTAFQNVADSLHSIQQDAETLKAASSAKTAASVTLELARLHYQSGYANYLTLLSAEQTYQQAVLAFVQTQANRYADIAALFQSLGGGWWNRPDIPKG
jgi:NodT family efflux transporter outer membrane factor (OMF) lipoprotein